MEKDHRRTRQGEAIKRAFERANRPLSPQQALDAARAEVKGLGIATVYRNIKALVDSKWLAPVDLPGAPAVYERAGKIHHHHFHCEGCSRVFELTGCIPRINRLAGRRFSVTRHELVLYGLCAECKAVRRA